METQIVNARISDTALGFEDHGIFTAHLQCEWPGASCAFGGYGLGADKPGRNASGFGAAFIQHVLRTVGVSKWEELRGKFLRIEIGPNGSGIFRIGHIIEDRWFDPNELAHAFRPQVVG